MACTIILLIDSLYQYGEKRNRLGLDEAVKENEMGFSGWEDDCRQTRRERTRF